MQERLDRGRGSVVLDSRCGGYSGNRITGEDSIVFELIKAVIGHAIVAAEHERLHATQRLAHEICPLARLALRAGPLPAAENG
jgi:hypothetical protein